MKKIKQLVVKLNLMNIFSVFFYIFWMIPIRKNKIVFINYHGKGYGDGGKYIAEKLLNKKADIYWAVNDMKSSFPSGIKKVKINSIAYFYHLSTAKIWVNNSRFPQYVRKRKSQYYIQIWHGCLALKKIEYDAYDKMTEYYKKWMPNDTKMTNLMVSNSDFCTKMFKRAFRYDGEVLEVGSPRNDILVKSNVLIKDKVKEKYSINKDERILLYAPTFRVDYSNNPYDIDFDRIQKVLEKKTKCKWRIMIRLHPIIKNPENYIKNMSNYINANNYPDMQELIIACDMLITDYSSTMFETMIADKIVVLYTKDLNDYNSERGTYFNIKELPFINAASNDELMEKINKIDQFEYEKQYDKFKKQIKLNESGESSDIVAKRIINIISGDNDE